MIAGSLTSSDVLVIGGGISGVSSAYHLAKAGVAVTLIEEDRIGGRVASSYGNMGLLVPSHALPVASPGVVAKGLRWMLRSDSPFYIRPRWDRELLRWLRGFRAAATHERAVAAAPLLYRLQAASVDLYQALGARLAKRADLERTGALYLVREQAAWSELREEAALLREAGVDAALLQADEVRERVPAANDSIIGGVFYREDARVVPDRLVVELAELARREGATIHEGVTVFRAVRDGGRGGGHGGRGSGRIREVYTSAGTLTPRQVVLAAGAWSPQLVASLSLRLPIQPAKGYSITVERPDACPAIPTHLYEAKVVASPMGPGRMRLGGTLELAGMDRSVNPRRIQAILAAVPRYLNGLYDLRVLEIWRGLRPVTPDTLPIIGRPRHADNLLLATGHGMIGMSMGAITGQIIARLATGEDPGFDLTLLSPDRF